MAAAGVNRILEAAREIQDFCASESWNFCFIGAIAVQRWGEPRLTQDADLEVFTGIGDEQRYIDKLLARFGARLENAKDFAAKHRVLLLHAANGVPLDVSPGSLVVFKAFADRPQDWRDVEGVIVRSGALIDW